MEKHLIRNYKSDNFQLITRAFHLFNYYEKGGLKEFITYLQANEVSQTYLDKWHEQLKGEPDVFTALSIIRKENLFNNLYYLNHAGKLLEIIQKENLDFIVLKGFSLIIHVYKDMGLRQFCDLDLLIHQEDVPRFLEIATKAGYNLSSYPGDPASRVEFDLYNEKLKIKVDVTISLSKGTYIDKYYNLGDWNYWDHKKLLKIGETQVYRLSEEDEVIYALLHMAFHVNFNISIKWLFDLHFYFEKYGHTLDRTYLNDQIRKAGLEHVIFTINEIMKWAFKKDFSGLFGDLDIRFYLFDWTWLTFYAYPPRLFGDSPKFTGVAKRMSITFMKNAFIARSSLKLLFIANRIIPGPKRIRFAYKHRLTISKRLFSSLLTCFSLILSPFTLLFYLAVFLISTIIIKTYIYQQDFSHE